MSTFVIASALKAQQWERAKGELRALVALQGSHSSNDRPPGEISETEARWRDLAARVARFISSVEEDGLQE